MTLRFQGTFTFNAAQVQKLKPTPAWQQVVQLGGYTETSTPTANGRGRSWADDSGKIVCAASDDVTIGTYLLQQGIRFSFEPSPKIKKRMNAPKR